MKSEIMHPRNCNKEKCNISDDEMIARKDLVRLQRERVITIKPCDKGAVIIILDFVLYIIACYEHLLAKQPNDKSAEPNHIIKKKMTLH